MADLLSDDDVGIGAPKVLSDADVGLAEPKPAIAPGPDVDAGRGNPFAMSEGEAAFSNTAPEAFLDRVRRGQVLDRILSSTVKGWKEGGEGSTPTGFSDETLQQLTDLGIFHDPSKGSGGPIQMLNEGIMLPTASAWQGFMSAVNSGLHAAGGALGQIVEESGGSQGTGESAKNEVINAGNWAMIEGGFGRFQRTKIGGDGAVDQVVGGLPKPEDFQNGAKVIGGNAPVVEQNLQTLWQDKGIHPAEAVHDAQTDAFLKHDLTTKGEPAKASPELVEETGGLIPHDLGAAVNSDAPFVPLSEQPASRSGSLMTAARAGMDQLNGLARNLQYVLDPMATGSDRAMVIAKDAINSVRRIRWDQSRIVEDLKQNFDVEQLGRMWNAADEESVARQLGESTEHQGLTTLEPAERAAVERLHADAQAAWFHARDVGMVEGEGLPSYTPRMVVNVAAASDHVGPTALNELGRNVFTRTAQMLHRGYMTAEETEAAAKSLVGKRMAERGANPKEISDAVDKVKIARDIRSLPLAVGKLQEAAVWRDMINKIEATGKATGTDTVAYGHQPDSSWFTIAGNPAFTRWGPAFDAEGAARLDASGKPLFVPKPIYMSSEFKGPMSAILDPVRSKLVQGAMSPYEALMALKGKSMTAIMNSPLIHNQVVWGKVLEAAGGREQLGFGLYFRGNKIVNGATGRAQELIERGLNPIGHRASYQDITGMMEEPNLQPGRSITSQVLAFIPGLFDERAGNFMKRAIDKAGDFTHNTLLWDRVRDVHFGLADHMSDQLVAKGVDRVMADRISTHFSNMVVGSIPKEAMSSMARGVANSLLFSRSFTLGNIAAFKQAALGLPKPIVAQLGRDFFDFKENPETGNWESPQAALGPDAAGYVAKLSKGMARRKAISTIAMSTALYYIAPTILQHALDMTIKGHTLSDEMDGYARRYRSLMDSVGSDPWELRHMLSRLSPSADNEPEKGGRVHIGHDPADGAALYARMPVGKYGEENIGYMTQPMNVLRSKLSPTAGAMLDILTNDQGFGRKIYNDKDNTVAGDIRTGVAIGEHIIMKHLPSGQMSAAWDMLRGDGDKTTNAMRLVAPMAGFTVSRGAPGGEAKGEGYGIKDAFEARFSLALPDIKRQIKRGDEAGAREAMTALRTPDWLQKSIIKNTRSPGGFGSSTLRDLMHEASPEQLERFNRARR